MIQVNVGEASVAPFGQVFEAMFTAIVPLPDAPAWRDGVGTLDGVIELERVDAEWYDLSDGIRIAYRVCLYDSKLVQVRCWTPTASAWPGSDFEMCLYVAACARDGIDAAIREATARFMIDFDRDPAVRAWARGRATVAPKVASPGSGGQKLGLLMWPPLWSAGGRAYEREMERCVSDGIAAIAPEFTLLSDRAMRDALFPLFERATQPADDEAFAALLTNEEVRGRLSERGIGHLILLAGTTATDDWTSLGFCGYTGCLGFGWRGEKTELRAALWSVASGKELRQQSASVTGTSVMPALVLPIPLPARTLAGACRALAEQTVTAIREPASR